ncbi:hypothetical protein [Serratia symbiotica]|uniref:hypothetical protein n=1 Tax=Serratia symbiotica TaxID=138074 RepID=UPI003463F598
MTVGDKALSEAVKYYTEWVYQVSVIGACVSADEWNAPLFTYLMTKKQFNELKLICNHQGWPPVSRGITFLPRTIKHIITARMGKDDLTWQDCATVLSASLNGV